MIPIFTSFNFESNPVTVISISWSLWITPYSLTVTSIVALIPWFPTSATKVCFVSAACTTTGLMNCTPIPAIGRVKPKMRPPKTIAFFIHCFFALYIV